MDEASDTEFADRALERLRPVSPPPGLEAALLAAYDGWRAGRRTGLFAGVLCALRAGGEIVWPGAPLWAPVGALGAAVAVGIGLSLLLPQMQADAMGFSLERTPNYSLLSVDAQENL